jgi:hypothetical protein
MATKVDKATPAAAKAAVGVDDLDVLQPDRAITVAGRRITVREFRFFEGLRLRAQHAPFFDDLYALFTSAATPPGFEQVALVLGAHQGAVADMVALATDTEAEWVLGLGDADGDSLLVTWWLVNAGFFVRGLMRRAAQQRLAARPSDGPASTTSSSPQDTSEVPTSSDA